MDSLLDDKDQRNTAKKRYLVIVVALVAVAVLAFALAKLTSGPVSPSSESAEAGFARDMAQHHAQAVEMAEFIRDDSAPPDLEVLARDIVLTQQAQIGQMQGWLAVWDLPIGDGETMEWMGHQGPMPGMASAAQLEQLQEASGAEKERLFLEMMIPHHEGGVEMARAVLERTENEAVSRLAQAIVNAQTAELDTLRKMLAVYETPQDQLATNVHSASGTNHS